jgi:hypothetical protein
MWWREQRTAAPLMWPGAGVLYIISFSQQPKTLDRKNQKPETRYPKTERALRQRHRDIGACTSPSTKPP